MEQNLLYDPAEDGLKMGPSRPNDWSGAGAGLQVMTCGAPDLARQIEVGDGRAQMARFHVHGVPTCVRAGEMAMEEDDGDVGLVSTGGAAVTRLVRRGAAGQAGRQETRDCEMMDFRAGGLAMLRWRLFQQLRRRPSSRAAPWLSGCNWMRLPCNR